MFRLNFWIAFFDTLCRLEYFTRTWSTITQDTSTQETAYTVTNMLEIRKDLCGEWKEIKIILMDENVKLNGWKVQEKT